MLLLPPLTLPPQLPPLLRRRCAADALPLPPLFPPPPLPLHRCHCTATAVVAPPLPPPLRCR
jgi:hypothetical protein